LCDAAVTHHAVRTGSDHRMVGVGRNLCGSSSPILGELGLLSPGKGRLRESWEQPPVPSGAARELERGLGTSVGWWDEG